ncbi:MAG: hypothetical protein D6681_14850 [Calditrichaeota bacterium]|nr:MAG: hypothetical protein D6681_14850 [Calditrichota bacterium]
MRPHNRVPQIFWVFSIPGQNLEGAFMMSKPSRSLSGEVAPHPPAEDFFELPRIEFLLNELQENPPKDITAMVQNERSHLPDRFSMVVEDNRMAPMGICQGDYVVIQQLPRYQDGDIVAARIGNQVLIRRYYHRGGRIRLEAPPIGHQTMIIDPTAPGFAILGKVIQVVREL